MTRAICAFAVALFSLAFIGCGGDGPTGTQRLDMGGDDGTKISILVEDMNDAKGNAKKFNAMFVKGSAPTGAEAKKFNAFAYYNLPNTKPAVNGSDATAKVSVQNEGTGTNVEVEWSFVKEGDQWKIKSAPLQ